LKEIYKPSRIQKNEKALIKRVNYGLAIRHDAAKFFRLRKPRGSYSSPAYEYFIEDTRSGRTVEAGLKVEQLYAIAGGHYDFALADLELAA
jgi:hypothetical protein